MVVRGFTRTYVTSEPMLVIPRKPGPQQFFATLTGALLIPDACRKL
jgi:hypothetical protein